MRIRYVRYNTNKRPLLNFPAVDSEMRSCPNGILTMLSNRLEASLIGSYNDSPSEARLISVLCLIFYVNTIRRKLNVTNMLGLVAI